MGRVLHFGPSWHGPSFMWAELVWAELVLGRVVLHPPYGTHAEPGCTPHMGGPYGTHIGMFAGQLQTVEIQMSRLIRIFTVYFLFQ